jgi:hypothetical protein
MNTTNYAKDSANLYQGGILQYAVTLVKLADLKPSPENDDIYGETTHDDDMQRLIDSIEVNGLEEPLIVTKDLYIISGHRRYFALSQIKQPNSEVPVRIKEYRKDERSDFQRLLTEYNPQRVKTPAMVLREALVRFSARDPRKAIESHYEEASETDVNYLTVKGKKSIGKISEGKMEFLEAAKSVVMSLKPFWPVAVRQIHYNLLNNAPLKLTAKRSKFTLEHYRYKNDRESYKALIDLLTVARYLGHIPMHVIDDISRPRGWHQGYSSASEFINVQLEGFLDGYHRDKQDGQVRHIEVLFEKNTLMQIFRPVCDEYYVPWSSGRGYSSIPIFRDIASRFNKSGRKTMTLIVASDFDPEGLDLAEDAVRTLRDLWGIPIEYHRLGVNREQINEFNLAEDFNPAKVTSSRYNKFVNETGSKKTWELEALPPQALQQGLREAIKANMNMEIYNEIVSQEQKDANEIMRFRSEIIEGIR